MKRKILTLAAVLILTLGAGLGSMAVSSPTPAAAASDCNPGINGGYCHPCYNVQYVQSGYWYMDYYWTGFSWAPYYRWVSTNHYENVLEWHWSAPYGDYGSCY